MAAPASSERFPPTSNDTDVTLISSDNVAFGVHRANLIASSHVFQTMFEIASGGSAEGRRPEVDLEEDAKTLEIVLPYAYNSFIPPFVFDFPQTFVVIKAMHKYGIWRGIDAVSRAFRDLYIERSISSAGDAENFKMNVYMFIFARFTEDIFLRRIAFDKIVEAEPSLETLESVVIENDKIFKADETNQLVNIFLRHRLHIRDLHGAIAARHKLKSHRTDCKTRQSTTFALVWMDLSQVSHLPSIKTIVERWKSEINPRYFGSWTKCDECEDIVESMDEFVTAVEKLSPRIV